MLNDLASFILPGCIDFGTNLMLIDLTKAASISRLTCLLYWFYLSLDLGYELRAHDLLKLTV